MTYRLFKKGGGVDLFWKKKKTEKREVRTNTVGRIGNRHIFKDSTATTSRRVVLEFSEPIDYRKLMAMIYNNGASYCIDPDIDRDVELGRFVDDANLEERP